MPNPNLTSKGTALITGACSGIGAAYADRLAHRGYDLILVACDGERLEALARRLTPSTGRFVRVLAADVNRRTDLARVEHVLGADGSITVVVNQAAAATASSDPDRSAGMIQLNLLTASRLALATIPGFVARGRGTLINVSPAGALAPDMFNGGNRGSKTCVVNLSVRLQQEFARKGVRVQVVLAGATRAGAAPPSRSMDVDEMVDSALAGLDGGEVVTIPSLRDIGDWHGCEVMRYGIAAA